MGAAATTNEAVNDVLPEPPGSGPPSSLRDARACGRVCEPRSRARALRMRAEEASPAASIGLVSEEHRSAGAHVGFDKHNRAAMRLEARGRRKEVGARNESAGSTEHGTCPERRAGVSPAADPISDVVDRRADGADGERSPQD